MRTPSPEARERNERPLTSRESEILNVLLDRHNKYLWTQAQKYATGTRTDALDAYQEQTLIVMGLVKRYGEKALLPEFFSILHTTISSRGIDRFRKNANSGGLCTYSIENTFADNSYHSTPSNVGVAYDYSINRERVPIFFNGVSPEDEILGFDLYLKIKSKLKTPISLKILEALFDPTPEFIAFSTVNKKSRKVTHYLTIERFFNISHNKMVKSLNEIRKTTKEVLGR